MGFTRNYWSIVENDRRILTEPHLAKIVELFEFDPEEQRELLNLRTAAKGRGWWTRHSSLLDDTTQRLFGMEHGAQAIRVYESGMITGLLQTREYARGVFGANIFTRQADIDSLVDVRMHRQERVFGADPAHITVVMGYAGLRQQPGGPDVQRTALHHLAELVETHSDTLDLRVLPYEATGRGVIGASTFYLFDFPSPHLPTLAWYETVTIVGFIEDRAQVRDLNVIYTRVQDEALDREDSLKLIQRTAEEIS
jgi:hypothetical protein